MAPTARASLTRGDRMRHAALLPGSYDWVPLMRPAREFLKAIAYGGIRLIWARF